MNKFKKVPRSSLLVLVCLQNMWFIGARTVHGSQVRRFSKRVSLSLLCNSQVELGQTQGQVGAAEARALTLPTSTDRPVSAPDRSSYVATLFLRWVPTFPIMRSPHHCSLLSQTPQGKASSPLSPSVRFCLWGCCSPSITTTASTHVRYCRLCR